MAGFGAPRDLVDELAWPEIEAALDVRGYAVLPPILSPEQCTELTALYGDDTRFRKRIDMGAHAYGEGEYKYFAYPLPPVVQELREAFYAHLAPTANRWAGDLGLTANYPDRLNEFVA